MFSKILNQLLHLRSTVNTSYGTSFYDYLHFFYYSLFRKNRFIIFYLDLNSNIVKSYEGNNFDIISPLSLNELIKFRAGKKFPREYYCDEINNAKYLTAVIVDGELAHIHWIYFKGEFSRFFKIGHDSAELSYSITLPKYRGHRLSSIAYRYTTEALKGRNIKNLYTAVHEDNIASIKTVKDAGFVEIGTIDAIGRFNRKISI